MMFKNERLQPTAQKEFKTGILDNLKELLENERHTKTGQWKDGRQISLDRVMSVQRDGKTYEFYQNTPIDGDIKVDVLDENGVSVRTVYLHKGEAEANYLEKLFERDIPTGLQEALDNDRFVTYEGWERQKHVNVRWRDRDYSINSLPYSNGWHIQARTENKSQTEYLPISQPLDQEYLEKLFERDIPDQVRALMDQLKEGPQEYYDATFVRIEWHDRIYTFERTSATYTRWAMIITTKANQLLHSVEIREEADVEYLDAFPDELEEDEDDEQEA